MGSNNQSSTQENWMINEQDICKTCLSDKEKGFRMLMDRYQVAIYNYVRRMVVAHEDAQDVTQDTFVRIYRNIDTFRNDGSLTTWIYRIATTECLRFLNRRKETFISSEDVRDSLLAKLESSDYIDYGNALAVKFQKAVISLPEKQRVVFNLRYYDELEYSEISRITGVSVDSLKVNYHYAKDKIKEYIINR